MAGTKRRKPCLNLLEPVNHEGHRKTLIYRDREVRQYHCECGSVIIEVR